MARAAGEARAPARAGRGDAAAGIPSGRSPPRAFRAARSRRPLCTHAGGGGMESEKEKQAWKGKKDSRQPRTPQRRGRKRERPSSLPGKNRRRYTREPAARSVPPRARRDAAHSVPSIPFRRKTPQTNPRETRTQEARMGTRASSRKRRASRHRRARAREIPPLRMQKGKRGTAAPRRDTAAPP